MCRRKVGVVPPEKKLGAKKLLHLFGNFRRLRHLMANICWTKCDTDNQARALESAKGLLRCCKISRTLVHKWLKTGPEVLPTITIYAIASGGLKWQYIAIIATFSSFIYNSCFCLQHSVDWRLPESPEDAEVFCHSSLPKMTRWQRVYILTVYRLTLITRPTWSFVHTLKHISYEHVYIITYNNSKNQLEKVAIIAMYCHLRPPDAISFLI